MIGAREEPRRGAATVGELERRSVAGDLDGGRTRDLADGLGRQPPVVGDRGGHVVRAFEPALDLERRDPAAGLSHDRRERADHVGADQVLGRQQVLDLAEVARLAIHDQAVGQAARLRALTAVRRPAPPRLGGQALATPRHAQRAVDEHLERDRGPGRVGADLVDRQLARDHHPGQAEVRQQPDGERARRGHLGGGVDLEVGAHRARDPGDRGILDDDGVDARGRDAPQQLLDDGQLGLEHEGVERDVQPGAGAVDPRGDLVQAVGREVRGPGAGVEAVVEPEVDRVSAGGEGGREGVAVAGGGENLGAAHAGATFAGSVPYHAWSWKPSRTRVLALPKTLALRIPLSL